MGYHSIYKYIYSIIYARKHPAAPPTHSIGTNSMLRVHFSRTAVDRDQCSAVLIN